jgi:hypothetical protein
LEDVNKEHPSDELAPTHGLGALGSYGSVGLGDIVVGLLVVGIEQAAAPQEAEDASA